MAKKKIEYRIKIYSEGGCYFDIDGRWEKEKDVPAWVKSLHKGKLPSEKLIYLGSDGKVGKVFVVVDKIAAFRVLRVETNVS